MEKQRDPKDQKPFSMKRAVLLVTYAIVLFLLIYQIDQVWNALRFLLNALKPLFWGIALAYLFHIPVDFIKFKILSGLENHRSGRVRKLRTGLSMAIAYVLVFAVIIGLGALVIPRAIESMSGLVNSFSGYLSSFQAWADGVLASLSVGRDISEAVSNLWNNLTGTMETVMGAIVGYAVNFTIGFTSGIMDFVVAIMFSGFILYNQKSLFEQMRRLFSALLGKKRMIKALEIMHLSDNVFSRFVMGQFVAAIILGVLCFIGMTLFGMHYALLISTIIGITAIIPILGAFIGTIPCAVILLIINPMEAFWFVVFIILLQQVEGNLIYPRVVGNAVGLSGLWVLVSLIIGGGLFGVWGMLLGTPVFAVIYHLVDRWLDTRRESET